MRRQQGRQSGAILIVTLWILTIVMLLAMGLAYRMNIEIKLMQVFITRFKCFQITKSAVLRCVAESLQDLETGGDEEDEDREFPAGAYFAYGLPWAVDEERYREITLGEGQFTVFFDAYSQDDEEPERYYGIEDEQARININTIASLKNENQAKTILQNLFNEDVDEDVKSEIAGAIIDWVDKEEPLSELGGAEDEYYKDLDPPYAARDGYFRSPEELLLVKGMTPEFYQLIRDKITVYGNGQVNVNTASRDVLLALGNLGESFVDRLVDYRVGDDGVLGTDDDGVIGHIQNVETEIGFTSGSVAAWEQLKQEVALIQDNEEEMAQKEPLSLVGVTSHVFRVHAEAHVSYSPLRKSITAIFERFPKVEGQNSDSHEDAQTDEDEKYRFLYWREE